jgi:trigger factor
LSFTIKKSEKTGNKVLMEVEVANSHFKKSINKAYKNISDKAKIPGFRPGKVPYNIIDLNYGKENVLSEAANLSISDLYGQIIEESEIAPIDYPKVDIDEIKEDKALLFKITVEVEPDIEIGKYKGIESEVMPIDVEDEELDEHIEGIKNRFASLEPTEEGYVSQKGDYLTIDFVGKIDGAPFEGGSANDYTLEVGSNTLFKEFEEILIGAKKGEKKEVAITLPQDIANKDIVGKDAHFEIEVKEIKKKNVPAIDEEFLKNMGDYKSVDEFRDFVKERISEQKKELRKKKVLNDVLQKLIDDVKAEIPQVMIDNNMQDIKKNFDDWMTQQKMTKEDYLKMANISEKDMQEEMKQRAIRDVKQYLILNKIEELEKDHIGISELEVENEIKTTLGSIRNAEQKKKTEDFLKTERGIKNIQAVIRRRKVMDYLVDNAKIIETKPKKEKNEKELWTPGKEDKEGPKKIIKP